MTKNINFSFLSSTTTSPAYEFGNMMMQLAQDMNQVFDNMPELKKNESFIDYKEVECSHFTPVNTYPSKSQLLQLAFTTLHSQDLQTLTELYHITSFNPQIIPKTQLKFTLKFLITQYFTHYLQSKLVYSEILNIINQVSTTLTSQIDLDFIFSLPKIKIPNLDFEYYLTWLSFSQICNGLIFNSVCQQIITQLEKINNLKSQLNLYGIFLICKLTDFDEFVQEEANEFYRNQKDVKLVDLRIQAMVGVMVLQSQ